MYEAYLSAFFEKRGIKWTKSKNEIRILCPFHADRNPSFDINVVKGYWKCWSCGAAGKSVETFVKKLTGEDVKLSDFISEKDVINTQLNLTSQESADIVLVNQDSLKFKENLEIIKNDFVPAFKSQIAMDYLMGPKRKLQFDTIRDFGLMYCDNGYYAGRVIIPYLNGYDWVGFNGRLIDASKTEFKDARYRYYLNKEKFKGFIYGDETPGSTCILVEGPFDLMWMRQNHYNQTYSTLSTEVNYNHLLKLCHFKRFVFLFDSDRESGAGRAKALKNAEKILSALPTKQCYLAELPEGKDPNESTTQEITYALNNLKKIILKA